VQVLSGRLPAQQAAITVGRRAYELDGPLSNVVRPGPWRPLGSVDNYSLFGRTGSLHPVYAAGPAGSTGVAGPAGRPPPQVGVVSDSANAETIRVRTASSTVLVRNVAWDDGWHASVTVNGGPATTLRVARRGLVEQVRVPAGADLVTFTYRPPHWLVASALSAGASLVLLVLAVVTVLRRGRRGSKSRGHRGVRRRRRSEERAAPLEATAPPARAGSRASAARDPYEVSSRGGPA